MEVDFLLEEREIFLNEIIEKIDSLIFINHCLVYLIIILLILFIFIVVYNYD